MDTTSFLPGKESGFCVDDLAARGPPSSRGRARLASPGTRGVRDSPTTGRSGNERCRSARASAPQEFQPGVDGKKSREGW